jgi:hypothetical protein
MRNRSARRCSAKIKCSLSFSTIPSISATSLSLRNCINTCSDNTKTKQVLPTKSYEYLRQVSIRRHDSYSFQLWCTGTCEVNRGWYLPSFPINLFLPSVLLMFQVEIKMLQSLFNVLKQTSYYHVSKVDDSHIRYASKKFYYFFKYFFDVG